MNRRKLTQRRFASIDPDRKRYETELSKSNRYDTGSVPKNLGKHSCILCLIMNRSVKLCNKCKNYYCPKCIKDKQHIC